MSMSYSNVRVVPDKARVLLCVIAGPPLQSAMKYERCRLQNHISLSHDARLQNHISLLHDANAQLGFHHNPLIHHRKISDPTPVQGRTFAQKLDRECLVFNFWEK
ncbi:hypothetical protein P8452_16675 [Trifolium repens]|nr:hypothetical protein P8452_16675 [Trifolium repens]